ncbi:hypothetical protein BDZ85DRAFT_318515 [Elsinoe ampelina]|uniref:EF hand domain-containing protein n=1 Tax=Elsinoe ampelina TaxID=302913 RepID=A0A6A6GG51_9PEZI|nr:hypothetical protein BDZ85DRAFT_318515 [Elsinoe ampelina]
MSSPAATSAVTRYRPAVLIATGLAAAYGTYLVYRGLTYPETTSRSSGLHRSNAVHRPHRHRRISIVTFISYDHQDGLFPDCICAVDDRQYSFSLAEGGPSRTAVMSALQLSPPETDTVIHEMQLPALEQIFHVIVNAQLDSEVAQSMPDIRDALDARDSTALLALEEVFTIGRWTFDLHAFQAAVASWCSRNAEDSPARLRSSVVTRRTINDDAETVADDSDAEEERDPGQGAKGLLYHIAEDEAKKSSYIHRGTRCDSCSQLPITGIRWHCLNCPDFDLCSACEALGQHVRTHVFAKITIPISPRAQPRVMYPVWYPGNPQAAIPVRLSEAERKEHSEKTGFDEPRIEALYDQFFCLASVFRDVNGTVDYLGIDRFTFHKVFAGDRAKHPVAPNYLYDRLFDFYDENKDGQITFPEFVHGLAYLQMPAKRRSLDKVFQGYDADGDGYVNRADMIRMLRAKYMIHKEMTMDIVTIEDAQPLAFGMNYERAMRSNRTLSSMFSEAEIPRGQGINPYNKPVDPFGDGQVVPHPIYSRSILPNGQTDIDITFWEAVFGKHGRPYLSELHPQFNDRLEARLQVRPRYTGSESYELDGTDRRGEKYLLVPVDSRDRRPIFSTRESLAEEWKEDIADVNAKLTNGRVSGNKDHSPLNAVHEKGQTIVVTPEERDLGDEVLYQVIEDAINESLDDFFIEKRELSKRCVDSRADRKRWRKELDEFIKNRDENKVEEVTDKEAEKEDADDEEDDLFVKQDEYVDSTTLEAARSVRSASPSPEQDLGPSDSSLQQLPQSSTLDANPQEEETRPQINQADVVSQIQATAVPTDEGSLQSMERDIRDQDLDSLLAAAGYSVADEESISEAPANDVARPREEVEQDGRDANGVASESPRENVNVSLAAFRGTRQSSAFSDRPNAAASPDNHGSFVVPDTSSSGSSKANSEGESDAGEDDGDRLRELPWTPASVRSTSNGDMDHVKDNEKGAPSDLDEAKKDDPHANHTVSGSNSEIGDGSPKSQREDAATSEKTDVSDGVKTADQEKCGTSNGVSKEANASDDKGREDKTSTSSRRSSVSTKDPPSLEQLEEWAMLEKEDKEFMDRGGPAVLNFSEFEDIIWRDEEKGDWKKGLKGIAEGWLEFAHI